MVNKAELNARLDDLHQMAIEEEDGEGISADSLKDFRTFLDMEETKLPDHIVLNHDYNIRARWELPGEDYLALLFLGDERVQYVIKLLGIDVYGTVAFPDPDILGDD